MISIRIIHDLVYVKDIQYQQIKRYFPKHELYKYDYYDNQKFNKVYYNIYLDSISENIYLNAPCKKTILVVNEEYLMHTEYIRRENYIDKPLMYIKDVVDYYFCFSEYTLNYLVNKNIDKNKIILIKCLCYNIYKNIKIVPFSGHRKYILYKIDKYGYYDNLLVLNTWIKYFLDRKEILVIRYNDKKELFIKELENRMNKKINNKKINYYKNIIVLNDEISLENNKQLLDIENNINCLLLISTYFNLITLINEHIFKKHFIITPLNDISKEYIVKKECLIKEMSEKELYNSINNYFNLTDKKCLSIVNNIGRHFIECKKKSKLNIYNFFRV